MMSRPVFIAAILLACLTNALPARCDGLIDFLESIPKDAERRNCWPLPFVYPARQAAREPFVEMVGNGWEQQNMLSDQHFDAETGLLNEAGQAKVLWILNEVPEQHRGIFVHQARSTQETATRIQLVQQFVAQSAASPCDGAPVLESNRSADGYPAARYELSARKFVASAPDPKLLPKDSGGGGPGH
jgi:hypothetical protein